MQGPPISCTTSIRNSSGPSEEADWLLDDEDMNPVLVEDADCDDVDVVEDGEEVEEVDSEEVDSDDVDSEDSDAELIKLELDGELFSELDSE